MVDGKPARASACFGSQISFAHPKANQRTENGLGRKCGDFDDSGGGAPAAPSPGSPRSAGIPGKKKGPKSIRALLIGGARRN
jgi:hypothetical protein